MTDERLVAGDATEPRLEDLLDRITDGVFGLDSEWRFTYLNDTARDVVVDAASEGTTPDDLVGRTIWEVIPELEGTPFETQYRDAMRTQERTTFDAWYDPLDVWFEVRVYPSESGLSVCFRDVTERRHRQEQLERREATLREMYDVIADRDASFETRVDGLLRIGQRPRDGVRHSLPRAR